MNHYIGLILIQTLTSIWKAVPPMSWVSADAAQGRRWFHHDIPFRPWDVLGTDVFHFDNKNHLCLVDYHSKFPVVKKMGGAINWELNCYNKDHICRNGDTMQNNVRHRHKFCFRQFKRFCSSLHREPSSVISISPSK